MLEYCCFVVAVAVNSGLPNYNILTPFASTRLRLYHSVTIVGAEFKVPQ